MSVFLGTLLGLFGVVCILAGIQSRGGELYRVITGNAAPGDVIMKGKPRTASGTTTA